MAWLGTLAMQSSPMPMHTLLNAGAAYACSHVLSISLPATQGGDDCRLVMPMQLRAFPDLDNKGHLFEQHLDCAGAFGNPRAGPLLSADGITGSDDESLEGERETEDGMDGGNAPTCPDLNYEQYVPDLPKISSAVHSTPMTILVITQAPKGKRFTLVSSHSTL